MSLHDKDPVRLFVLLFLFSVFANFCSGIFNIYALKEIPIQHKNHGCRLLSSIV